MGMRSALRLIPLMVIGAAATFLLAGALTSFYKPHAVASRPQPSPSTTVDPHASPTTCPASLPMPKAPAALTPSTPSLPFPIWVNDPLGVNLRSAASGSGWSLMLPQGYQVAPSSNASLTTVSKTGDDLPFLILQTTTSDTLTIQLPGLLRPDIAPVADHTATIAVWSVNPVTEQVSRVALDTCKVTSAWARPDQGWPFMTAVYVHTKGRNYQFSFFTADANSAMVKQVLDSVALS